MRAWAIILAVAVLKAGAENSDIHRKSSKVGTFVETIGAGEVPIGDDGFARFTFWEKTYPDEEKPIVTCGLKTSKPGNYTLDIIRPDDTTEIILVIVERNEGDQKTKDLLKAHFPVDVERFRPSTVKINLLRDAEDKVGQLLGTVQITEPSSGSCRTKRSARKRAERKRMAKKRTARKRIGNILPRNKDSKSPKGKKMFKKNGKEKMNGKNTETTTTTSTPTTSTTTTTTTTTTPPATEPETTPSPPVKRSLAEMVKQQQNLLNNKNVGIRSLKNEKMRSNFLLKPKQQKGFKKPPVARANIKKFLL